MGNPHPNYEYQIKRWTQSAMDCYKRGCICNGCPVYELVFKPANRKCMMKGAVIATVRKFGIPANLIKKDRENYYG